MKRALWQCPECQARLTSAATDEQVARDGLVAVVRDHLKTIHADTADLTNAHAQAGGWLSAAGHLVELWGGPDDGATVWCPLGELPDVIGVQRTEDGALVPVRSATARLLPGVSTYRQGNLDAARVQGRAARYLYDGRPR